MRIYQLEDYSIALGQGIIQDDCIFYMWAMDSITDPTCRFKILKSKTLSFIYYKNILWVNFDILCLIIYKISYS